MLNKRARNFLLLLGFSIILVSCKKDEVKEEPTPLDYRQQWTGAYDVIRYCSTWGGAGGSSSQTADTIYVSILEGTLDSIAVEQTLIPIDSNGYYYNNPFSYNFYGVQFWNDSISINFASGGLGGGSSCETFGRKID